MLANLDTNTSTRRLANIRQFVKFVVQKRHSLGVKLVSNLSHEFYELTNVCQSMS